MFLRAGYTIPLVQPGNSSNVDLHIALKTINNSEGVSKYFSSGIFVLDDGESLHSYISSMMFYITISKLAYILSNSRIDVTGTVNETLKIEIETKKPKYVTSQYLYLDKYTNYGDIYLYGYKISTEESKKIKIIVKKYLIIP